MCNLCSTLQPYEETFSFSDVFGESGKRYVDEARLTLCYSCLELLLDLDLPDEGLDTKVFLYGVIKIDTFRYDGVFFVPEYLRIPALKMFYTCDWANTSYPIHLHRPNPGFVNQGFTVNLISVNWKKVLDLLFAIKSTGTVLFRDNSSLFKVLWTYTFDRHSGHTTFSVDVSERTFSHSNNKNFTCYYDNVDGFSYEGEFLLEGEHLVSMIDVITCVSENVEYFNGYLYTPFWSISFYPEYDKTCSRIHLLRED